MTSATILRNSAGTIPPLRNWSGEMAKQSRQPWFLGPTGPEVGVAFSPHALGRMIERLRRLLPRLPAVKAEQFVHMSADEQERVFCAAIDAGMPFESICSRIRQPNAGVPDAISTVSYGVTGGEGRYLRTLRLPIVGRARTCRVVFIVEVPQSDLTPGSILIVTFLIDR